MIHYKSKEEIELIRNSSLLVSKTLAEVAKYIKEGVTTLSLDIIAEQFIRDNYAVPGFKGYNGFPNTLCISINEEVVHGIPKNDRFIKDGDLVSVDCGVILNDYYGDSAYTFLVGNVSDDNRLFSNRTKESLYKGIEMAIPGNRLGDISFAIQNYVEKYGYSVVRELVGHGLGKQLHEKPEVPNYGKRGSGLVLQPGLVICIEPMINKGSKKVAWKKDNWTVFTADHYPSAHYEHTIAITNNKPDILTSFDFIEIL